MVVRDTKGTSQPDQIIPEHNFWSYLMILFGEGSLRRACSEFVEHYHTERAHQGLCNERVESVAPVGVGEVNCTERLGGILKHYRRAA